MHLDLFFFPFAMVILSTNQGVRRSSRRFWKLRSVFSRTSAFVPRHSSSSVSPQASVADRPQQERASSAAFGSAFARVSVIGVGPDAEFSEKEIVQPLESASRQSGRRFDSKRVAL